MVEVWVSFDEIQWKLLGRVENHEEAEALIKKESKIRKESKKDEDSDAIFVVKGDVDG